MRVFCQCVAMALVLLVGSLSAQPLQTLSDEQLSDISGQEGVLLSLDYYLNSRKTADVSTSGEKDSNYCTGGLAGMNCRFSWQVANRHQGASHSGGNNRNGEWLVYKDGYLSLSMNRLALDAAFLGDAASSSGTTYESWFDQKTFQDVAGVCLLSDGNGLANCSIPYIKAMPALRAHYPQTHGTYSNASKSSSGYNDVRLGLEVQGLAVEYDNGLTQGWMRNQNGSFAGLSLRDNAGPQAGFALGGSFYLYGF